MPVTIDTTTEPAAPGRSGQRKLAVTSAGQLWAVVTSLAETRFELWYSNDNGATWAENTGLRVAWEGGTDVSCSFFIDQDDHAHIAWHPQNGTGSGTVKYRRCGSISSSSGPWTQFKSITSGADFPDVVAHREGTGWVAHLVAESSGAVEWHRIPIGPTGTLGTTVSTSNVITSAGLGSRSPSIDFNHTGDGKTVAGSAPHLYFVSWSSTAVLYRKAVYAAGAWTLSTVRTIDTTTPDTLQLCSSIFDGSRTVVAWSPSSANTTVKIAERDAADTTTTIRTPPALSDGAITGLSVTADAAGNIYVAAVGTTSDDPKYVTYTRGLGTWGSWTTIEAATADSITTRRAAGYNFDALYATGTSPFTIRFNRVSLNSPPNGAPWVTTDGAYDINESLLLDWTFSDPNPADTQASYVLKRDIGGVLAYWRASDSSWQATEQTNVTATSAVTLASGWGLDADPAHLYYVKTTDAGGSTGPYGPALTVTPGEKSNPTLDEPDPADVLATSAATLEWTVVDQTAYRAVVTDDDNGDAVVFDSGWVADADSRQATTTSVLANGGSYTASITTRNSEGLDSDPDTAAFTVAYVPPAEPTLATDDSSNIWIDVEIINPEPVGDEPDVTSVDLYVKVEASHRPDGDRPAGGDGIRIAAGLAPNSTYRDWAVASGVPYLYRAVAHGANGTTSTSGWSDDEVSELVEEEV